MRLGSSFPAAAKFRHVGEVEEQAQEDEDDLHPCSLALSYPRARPQSADRRPNAAGGRKPRDRDCLK
jgi:hypothetical protein